MPFALASVLGEREERLDVAAVVAGLIDGRFGDEGAVGEAGVVQQAAEGWEADGSLSNVLVAVEAGAARSFGIVHVPDADGIETDGAANQSDGFLIAGLGDEVVSGDVAVALRGLEEKI